MKKTLFNKISALTLVIIMALSLTACKSKPDNKANSSENSTIASTDQTTTSNNTESETESETDVDANEETENNSSENNSSSSQSTPKNKISESKAKSIALKNAGIKENDDFGFEIEFIKKDDVQKYIICLYYNDQNYDYEIDALTGEIIYVFNPKSPSNDIKISKNEAKLIALNHVGVTTFDIDNYELSLEKEGKLWRYKISFHAGILDFDFVIDAANGQILRVERKNNG